MKFDLSLHGDWAKVKEVLAGGAGVKAALRGALQEEAEFLADKVRDKFRSGPFAPLSPMTLAARRLQGFQGTKTLFRTGDLFNAIKATPMDEDDTAFIGILRTVQAKNGQYLANLGDIHENGRTIVMRITPKMMRYLAVLRKEAGLAPSKSSGGSSTAGEGKVLIVVIPPRPFLKPAFDEWGPTVIDRVFERFARRASKLLGTP